ncbi:MAG: HAD family hydrolase [Eubacterium sp.]|nr:HAD family hydrolase [Eubacterium sp.]
MKKTGLIFDIDGTLWDATDVIAVSYTKTAEKAGLHINITGNDLRALFGRQMHEIGEHLFPMLPVKEAHELIDRCTVDENTALREVQPKAYPGVKETLDILSKQYPLYIVSNCAAGYPEAFMAATGTECCFSGHLCPDDTGLGKAENIRLIIQKYKLEKAFYIGDLDLDRQAAEAAGADFIHAAYGFGEVSEAILRIEDIYGLLEVIRKVENGIN